MKRKVFLPFFWVVGYIFLAIILETMFFPRIFKGSFQPDLILVLIILLGFFKSPVPASLIAFLLGSAQECITGTIPGAYISASTAIFFIASLLRIRFSFNSVYSQILGVLILAFFHKLFYLILLETFSSGDYLWREPQLMSFAEIISEAMIAPLVFWLFRRLPDFFDQLPKELKRVRAR